MTTLDRPAKSRLSTHQLINNVAEGLPAEMRLPSFKARSTPVAIGEVQTVAGGRAP